MDEDFENFEQESEELKFSVARFEEMLRKKALYFFDVDTFLYIVDHYIEKNDPARALEVIQIGQEQHPASVSFLIKHAQVCTLTNKLEMGLQLLHQAELLEPSDPDLYMLKGSLYCQLSQTALALESFNKAIPLTDNLAELYLNIAYVYQGEELYSDAIRFFKLSLQEDPTNDLALYEIAFCYDITGRVQESIDFYTRYIDEDPYSYAAWYNLGIVHHRAENFNEAIDAFDYAIVIKSDFASAWYNRGNTFASLSKYKEAIDSFRQTFEFEAPDALTYFNIGECYEQLDSMSDARDHYKKAARLSPDFSDAWFGIAVTLDHEERVFEAIHYIKKAIDLQDQNPEYWYGLGDCYRKLENLAEAENSYRKATELDPENAELWKDYAAVLQADNRPGEALEVLLMGLKNLPDSAELHYKLSTAYYKSGDQYHSYEHLHTGLHLDFDSHTMLFEDIADLMEDRTVVEMIDTFKNKA